MAVISFHLPQTPIFFHRRLTPTFFHRRSTPHSAALWMLTGSSSCRVEQRGDNCPFTFCGHFVFLLGCFGGWLLSGIRPALRTSVVSQPCVNWEFRLVRLSGKKDRKNGWLEVLCSDTPTGKLDLAEVMHEALPTLVAFKWMAGLPC